MEFTEDKEGLRIDWEATDSPVEKDMVTHGVYHILNTLRLIIAAGEHQEEGK